MAGKDFIHPGGSSAVTRVSNRETLPECTPQFHGFIPRDRAFCQSIGSNRSSGDASAETGGQVANRFRVLCHEESAKISPRVISALMKSLRHFSKLESVVNVSYPSSGGFVHNFHESGPVMVARLACRTSRQDIPCISRIWTPARI